MISVVIGTFGSDRWRDLAYSRAYQSVPAGVDVIVQHEDTLALARNRGAANARHNWLCFLDADDELAPGYLDAMWQAIRQEGARDRMFTPMVQQVQGLHGRHDVGPPFFFPEVDYRDGNWMVIGTVVPRSLFVEVGGFEEWPLYEDWALWARMQKAGAQPVRVPEAVYRAFQSGRTGRNRQGGRNAAVAAHDQIRRAVFPELYEEAV